MVDSSSENMVFGIAMSSSNKMTFGSVFLLVPWHPLAVYSVHRDPNVDTHTHTNTHTYLWVSFGTDGMDGQIASIKS